MAVGGGPLFGSSTPRTQSKALVEFRAGKMTYNTSTKMVTPDKRKGMVSVYQSEGDHLMHFTWKDRGNGNVEDDLIIFPDDVEFMAVPACTTGRVFLLKFKTSSKRMFFWMQEPKADKDEEYCKKVNDSLNNPPTPGSNRSSSSGALPSGIDFNNLGDSELQNLLNNMSQQQLMQLFGGSLGGGAGGAAPGALASLLGGMGAAGRSRQSGSRPRPLGITNTPSTTSSGSASTTSSTTGSTTTSTATTTSTTPATPANSAATTAAVRAAATAAPGTTAANPAIQLSDLQSILSNIPVPGGADGAASGARDSSVDLATSLNAEALQPLLSSPGFLDKVKDFLPKDESNKDVTADDLKGTVQSPQFQQAVSMFSMALQSGQLAPLVREFGLGEAAVLAAAQGDMLSFVQALQKEGRGDEKKKEDSTPEDLPMD